MRKKINASAIVIIFVAVVIVMLLVAYGDMKLIKREVLYLSFILAVVLKDTIKDTIWRPLTMVTAATAMIYNISLLLVR